jgi:hypothetical protein
MHGETIKFVITLLLFINKQPIRSGHGPQVLNPEVTTSNHELPHVWLTVLKSPSK